MALRARPRTDGTQRATLSAIPRLLQKIGTRESIKSESGGAAFQAPYLPTSINQPTLKHTAKMLCARMQAAWTSRRGPSLACSPTPEPHDLRRHWGLSHAAPPLRGGGRGSRRRSSRLVVNGPRHFCDGWSLAGMSAGSKRFVLALAKARQAEGPIRARGRAGLGGTTGIEAPVPGRRQARIKDEKKGMGAFDRYGRGLPMLEKVRCTSHPPLGTLPSQHSPVVKFPASPGGGSTG